MAKKVTFDVIQDGETIIMIGKAKSVQRAASASVESVQSERIEDLRTESDDEGTE